MGFGTNLMVSLMVVAALMFSITGLMLSMGATYDVEVDEDYVDVFDTFDQTEALYVSQQQTVEGGEIDPDAQDQAVFKDSITAAKQIQGAGKLASTGLADVAKVLHIHPVVIGIITAIIFVLLTATFIGLFFAGRTP